MEINDTLVERMFEVHARSLEKIERYRETMLKVQKMAVQIQQHHKNKEFHVDRAATQITEVILENII